MTKKKPYGNINRNRTLPNQSSKKNVGNKKSINKEKKEIENTTKIKIDSDRVSKEKVLDTSFLEGRLQDKNSKGKKEREKVLQETQAKARHLEFIKSLSFLLSFLCIIFLIILVILNQPKSVQVEEPIIEEEEEETVEFVIDDNYLFIGDLHIQNLSFEQFNYPYVVIGNPSMTVDSITQDMYHNVYIYNPSHVVLQVGLEDLVQGLRVDDIISHYRTIVTEIQNNRPNAKIYLESVYPINSKKIDDNNSYQNVNNATIKKLNQEIKKMAKSLNVTYVDIYSSLIENDSLKDSYSDDGVTLNEEGYKVVWNIFNKVVGE